MATPCGLATVLVPLLLGALHAGAPSAAHATDPAGIRDVRTSSVPDAPPFALTAGVVSGAAATAGYLILRRKRRDAPVPPVPSGGRETPLQTLHRYADLYRAGDLAPDALCLNLDPLIRSTLAARSGVPASPLTTAELLQLLRGEALLPAAEIAVAGELLDLCDRVKFAGAKPSPLEAERFLDGAVRLASKELEGAHEVR